MKFLVCIPDHQFYLWQTLVQINNFRKMGIEGKTVYLVSTRGNTISDTLKSLINSRELKSSFYLYNDERPSTKYSSSMRPHTIARFFRQFPEYGMEPFMYLDPDVLFTKPMDFSVFEKDDKWYVSDTRSYIDSRYIRSKGEPIFDKMCEIVGIDKNLVISNDANAGGAQYVMKNVNADYWDKVFWDSENLYHEITKMSNAIVAAEKTSTTLPGESPKKPYHPLQIWCADMWAVLWNGWYCGHEIEIHNDLDFAWASDSMDKWDKKYLFHNAGVPSENGKSFCKITYQVSPFNKEINIDPNNIGIKFVEEIRETQRNFPNLIW